LNPALGYVKTGRARSKIRQWFRRQDREKNIVQGHELLERELKRLDLTSMSHERVARLFQYDKLDDFLAAVGCGDINNQQIATRIIEAERKERAEAEEIYLPTLPPPAVVGDGVTVRGTGGLLTHLARCCSPVPGDDIVGYVTRGRGVTVHRRDCPNMLRIDEPERLIEVDWGTDKQTYPVMVHVVAYDRGGLMRDIAGLVAAADINMTSINVNTTKNIATFFATLEISDIAQLSSVLAKIERLPNVIEARRQAG
jgi:(p)ppGpp synthase/HD superfamily hydrolase